MKKRFRWSSLLSVVLFMSACGGSSDDSGGGTPATTTTTTMATTTTTLPGGTSATGNVSSNTTGVSTIATGAGAKITVPEGAVPKTATGASGTIAFSVEKDTSTTPVLPTGITKVSDMYRFGPGGTVFAKPVAVTLPLVGSFSSSLEYILYRVNQTTGKSEPYPATYDAATNSFTAQTYEFSPWWLGSRPAVDTASGCVNVDNSSSSIWRSVVTQQYTLKYPTTDTSFTGATATWAKSGTIGWASKGDWYLPQGSYQMCVEGTVNGADAHSALIPVNINSPWKYNNPVCTSLGISGVSLSLSGRCGASPTPTPTVGTGGLQISLTWHADPGVDLDLYVVEPGGEEISYGNLQSAAGGELDQDNRCSNYVNGQSENIYWTSPPSGNYAIKVHFFGTCSSSSSTSIPFDVRVVNNGVTTTYSGTATSGSGTSTFKTITVGSGGSTSTCPSGPFTNKVTVGTGFSGNNITGAGTSFSLASLANGGDLYARIESASVIESPRFARLYVNDGIYSQKDFCSNCDSPPVYVCPNLVIGKFRITDTGNYSIKGYSTLTGGFQETYINGTNISVGQ